MDKEHKRKMRRLFIKRSSLGFLGLLAACAPASSPQPTPTSTEVQKATPIDTPPSTPVRRITPSPYSPTSTSAANNLASSTPKQPETAIATSAPTSIKDTTVTPNAPKDNINITFPPELQQDAAKNFTASYQMFTDNYITSNGIPEGQAHLRVRADDGQGHKDISLSEAQGYGMLAAAAVQDEKTFDRLWQFTKAHLNQNGLMSWRLNSDGSIANGYNGQPDPNAATDGDLDIALALVQATKIWPKYEADALKLINAIKKHEIEPGTHILKPGDVWGGSDVTNPSYFSPYHYSVFKEFTGDNVWDDISAACAQVIQNTWNNLGGKDTGLVPEWVTAKGTKANNMGDNSQTYSYNACRTAWRQSMLIKSGMKNSPGYQTALELVQKQAKFFESVGPSSIVDGYALDGQPVGQWHNSTFVSTAANTALVSDNRQFQQAIYQETLRLQKEGYFGDSLRLLTLANLSPR